MEHPTQEDTDFLWLTKHTPELQKRYAGKWIAIVHQEVTGVGDTASEAYNQSRKKYPTMKPLLNVVPTEECLIL